MRRQERHNNTNDLPHLATYISSREVAEPGTWLIPAVASLGVAMKLPFLVTVFGSLGCVCSVGAPTAAEPHTYVSGRECGHRGQTAAALFQEVRAGGCGTLEYKGSARLSPAEIDELVTLLNTTPLRELDLSGTVLGNEEAAELAIGIGSAVRLGCREIDLSRTNIGDSAVKTLARTLERVLAEFPPWYSRKKGGSSFGFKLDLGSNRITDGGITELQALLPYLSDLDLSNNAITNAGARGLLSALPRSALYDLDLDRNQIQSTELLAQLRSSTNRDGSRIDIDSKHQNAPGSGAPVDPPQGQNNPPQGQNNGYGWDAVYDAVEALETDGLLTADKASALRRKAANDDPAVLRIFDKFGGFDAADPALLAKRLSELVAHEEL